MRLASPDKHAPGRFPSLAVAGLLALCIAPIVFLAAISSMLDRDCKLITTTEGEARPNLLWRIEVQRCGTGPEIANVLVAPRGKSFVLAVSARGTPSPVAVDRSENGTAWIVLDRPTVEGDSHRMLPLKATGRPAQPLVLVNGNPVR